jgi:predicted nucleic acid-binding Zn ribbon protein
VGYAPPPPPPPEPKPVQRVLAFKECPICGAKASPKEMTCKHCGAWFPKDTIR